MPVATVALASAMVTGAVTVSVPPQTLLVAVVTVSPVGSVSVKPTPVRETGLPAGFVMVNVKLVVALSAMVPGLNPFEIEGGASTVRLAVEVFPVPAFEDVTCTLLLNVPAMLPCTLTKTVQDPPPVIAPLARLTELPPLTAVMPPPHELLTPGVDATVIPPGKVSVNATPLRAVLELGFVMLSVKVLVPPTGIEFGVKLLEIDGGDATVRLADAVLPVPPLMEVTFPVVLV